MSEAANLTTRHNLDLDGPFGPQLHLKKYENVFRIAEGIVIVALLPLASHSAKKVP